MLLPETVHGVHYYLSVFFAPFRTLLPARIVLLWFVVRVCYCLVIFTLFFREFLYYSGGRGSVCRSLRKKVSVYVIYILPDQFGRIHHHTLLTALACKPAKL